jgi:mersacidin/lichenicidin family type 2 lantibiotic
MNGETHQEGDAKMSVEKIIRAWKDAEYRLSLSEAERALLPANPAGAIELGDAELEGVTGGMPADTKKGSLCTIPTPIGTQLACGCKLP